MCHQLDLAHVGTDATGDGQWATSQSGSPILEEACMDTTMVSVWWLLVTFMAGGFAGVLVMAVMALAADPDGDDLAPPVAR